MRRNIRVRMVLVGLLMVAAISVAAGSGRKPPAEQQTAVSARPLSTSEVMDILHKLPEMVPSYLGDQRNDTGLLKLLYPFKEVTSASMERVFPGVRFFQGLDRSRADVEYPYMIAIAGDKRYAMPEGFNRLLADNGQNVTDKNIVELAKAFVISAIGDERGSFPEITFLEAKRISRLMSGISYNARLKVKIGATMEEWHFAAWQGQLGLVSRGTTDGKLIRQYDLLRAKSPQQQGQLDLSPSIDIAASAPSNAYLEWQISGVDSVPHYYVVVDTNGFADSFKVRFSLSGFPTNATNVYVKVADTIRNTTRLLDTVHIDDQGAGTYDWTPPDDSTGICKVEADTLGLDSAYHNATGLPRKELTLERLKTGTFPGDTTETLRVYFCDQFFKDDANRGGESYAPTFARYVDSAMRESWRRQVNTWGLGTPPDTDHVYRVVVTDTVNWYHGLPVGSVLKPVVEHVVQDFLVAQAVATAGLGQQVGGIAHGLHAPGKDNRGATRPDEVRTHMDGLHP